jgi:hypothetical protein
VPRHIARLVTWLVVDYFDYTARPVPWHVARLITQLVAPLVIDYFAYAVHPCASARCVPRRVARHRLIHLRRASGCFGTSCGMSRDS